MSRDIRPTEGDAASEQYRRMPEGASLGGTETNVVAETLEPSEAASASDWASGLDGD